jgi:hypothetical protein
VRGDLDCGAIGYEEAHSGGGWIFGLGDFEVGVFSDDCRGYGPCWDVMVLESLVWEKWNGRFFRHK